MSIKFEGFKAAGGGAVTGALVYKGSYNATTNSPVLTSSSKGDFYIVSVAGTLASVSLSVGDHIVFNQNASSPITSAMFDVIDNTDAVASVNTQTGVVVLDTDDIAETATNQYFTNARFDTQLGTKTTDNVTEGSSNLYYTDARFDTRLGAKSTSDLSEGSNLYYTNARSDARIGAANLTDLNDVNYTAGAGINNYVLTYVHSNNRWEAVVSASAPVASVNTQTGAVVLDTDDIAEGSNLYYTNARFDTQLGTKTTDNVTEGSSNLYYTDARFDTRLGAKSTSDLSEGSNLYYTNARSDARIGAANLTDLSDVNYTAGAGINNYVLTYVHSNNRWEAVVSASAPVASVNTQTGAVVLDTDDIAEGSNLYYTNARFDTQLGTKTTDNVTEGSSNLYYTDARFDTRLGAKSTSDLSEGSNLYYTNARSDARIGAANLTDLSDVNYTAGAGINNYVLTYVHSNNRWEAVVSASAPVSSVNTQTGAVVLDTDDIAEGSNLYYTNARFDTQLGTKTTDNVTEGSSNLYYTNARFDTQLGTKTTDNVTEGSSNLYYTNARSDARIGAANLTDLNDVNYTAGAGINNYVLKYVHSNNRWEALAETGGGGGFTYSAIDNTDSPVPGAVENHYSANTSSGAITIDLPAIAAGNAGKEIRIKLKTAGNTLTISPDGTNQVEAGGAGTDYTLTLQNEAVTLVSDGVSNWEII